MKPHLEVNDEKMFYKYLDKSKVYFEYGSGGSTFQASIRKNINKIYSVESDKEWQNKLEQIIQSGNVTYFFNEMDTRPNTWGYPGANSNTLQHKNYSDHIRNISKEEQENIDLVFIDGRFRVACCLKCFDVINSECFIAFDDFLNRKEYHIVLNFYNIIERTSDNRMVILQKKKNVSTIPEHLIKKYELIMD
jgi:hypothetical protein